MLGGYMGKILRVDLSTGKIGTEPLNEQIAKDFIGARGYAVKIFSDEVDAKIDPLGPENKIIFATGPLTLTSSPAASRYNVVTKSPLNNTIAGSNSGGFWGPELKKAGYDMIIVEGKAEKPVYLWVSEDKVELKDATHLAGKDTSETTDTIIKDLGGDKQIKVSCIGPAGENLVKFSCIINEKTRAAGRTGVGAVMGSKNLKAIAVRGRKKVPIANEGKYKEFLKVAMDKVKANPVTSQGLPTYGTMVLNNIINQNGLYPTRNFQTGVFESVDMVSGEKLADTYLVKNKGCYGCPIACGRLTKLPDGEEGEGPEYETSWAFSADCGIDDLVAVTKANYMCNKMGLDTISTGATIASAMELYEKGYVKKEELEGAPELKFGNTDALLHYVEAIALRKGLGDKLAEGSYEFAKAHGHPELSMSVKKQDLPAYDPRGAQGHALEYATSNRGGCHVRGYLISPEILGSPEKLDPFVTEGKAQWVKTFQDLTAVIDSEGICLFTSFALGADDYANLLSAATGIDYSAEEALKAGERIWNLEKLWNIDIGLTKDDDTLPPRFLEEPMPDGASKGQIVHLDVTLPEYYELRGWSDTGIPTEAKLQELNLR
ncbi:MAG: aldehyde ferredoxin oxidoreductase family protein [Deltaproteobacteria bacterium]|nr:aldehyde ferredoxin oxidoreductase family protein [Deltaproteobacteria bacterium]